MFHDETVFPKPYKFDPERFIRENGTLRQDLLNPEFEGSFGFGRRSVFRDYSSHMTYI